MTPCNVFLTIEKTVPLKRQYTFTRLHGVTSHRTGICMVTTVGTSNIQRSVLIIILRKIKQDTQNTFNVTWRCVRATIVAVESRTYDTFWGCVSNLRYPECNAHAPYYTVICSLSGSTIFLHIISQMARFSKTSSWTQNVCFGCFYKFVWDISHYTRTKRDIT